MISRAVFPKIAGTPNITPMKPMNVKLGSLKKDKLKIFNDKDRVKSIALGTPRSTRAKIDRSDDDYQPRTPVAPSIKSARTTRAATRRAVKMEVVEEDRAGEKEVIESLQVYLDTADKELMQTHVNESLKILAAGFSDQKGASYGFGPNAGNAPTIAQELSLEKLDKFQTHSKSIENTFGFWGLSLDYHYRLAKT